MKNIKKYIIISGMVVFFHALIFIIITMPPFKKNRSYFKKVCENQKTNTQEWVSLKSNGASPVFFKVIPLSLDQTSPISAQLSPSTTSPDSLPHLQEQTVIVEKKETSLTAPIDPDISLKKDTIILSPLPKSPPCIPKKLLFNDITQGFAHYMHKNQGGDKYTMKGKKEGVVSMAQMKHAQYCSKICQAITQSLKANTERTFVNTSKITPSIKIIITLNKEGHLVEYKMLKTSGHTCVDDLIASTIKDASFSFPPIPDFFKMNTYTLPITMNNVLKEIEYPDEIRWEL